MAQQQQQRRDEFANAPRPQDRDDVRNKKDQSDRMREEFGTDVPVAQYVYYETNVATGYGAPVGGVPPGAYGVPDYETNVGGTNYDPAGAGYGTSTTTAPGYGAATGYGTAGVGAGQWGGQDATAGGEGGERGMGMNRNKGREQK